MPRNRSSSNLRGHQKYFNISVSLTEGKRYAAHQLLSLPRVKSAHVLWSFVLRWTVVFPVLSPPKCRDLRRKEIKSLSASSPHLTPGPRGSLAMEPPKADACYVPQEQRHDRKKTELAM